MLGGRTNSLVAVARTQELQTCTIAGMLGFGNIRLVADELVLDCSHRLVCSYKCHVGIE